MTKTYDGDPLADFALLEGLRGRVDAEALDDSGRYFLETYEDLTQCGHGDTGSFRNGKNGEAIALLWNLWKSDQLRVKTVQTPAIKPFIHPDDIFHDAEGRN